MVYKILFLQAQLVALKEELNSASKDSECAADESADEASKQKLVEELGRAKALVKVANLQLENLRGGQLVLCMYQMPECR